MLFIEAPSLTHSFQHLGLSIPPEMAFKLAITVCFLLVGLVHNLPWIPEARTNNEEWMHKHEVMLNQTHAHAAAIKVVFLGDSITEGWAYNGKEVWAQHYANRGAYNYGIGGDQTQHILWRIGTEFEHVTPKLIVLKIGTNNIGGNTPGEIATGIFAILEAIHTKMPTAKVLLLSVLPRNNVPFDSAVHEINAQIGKYADASKEVYYLDLTAHFETGLAHEKFELFRDDQLHLSPKGYEEWYTAMEPQFAKLIA